MQTLETRYEREARLVEKARAEGVQLLHSASTGAYYATSGSRPGVRYHVTPEGCECQGFARYGYCKHTAALHAALARPACQWCEGTGRVERDRSRWIGGGKTGYRRTWTVHEACDHCGGSGQVQDDRQAA